MIQYSKTFALHVQTSWNQAHAPHLVKSFPKTPRTRSEASPFGGSHNYKTKQNKTNQTTFVDRWSHNFRLGTCISVKKGISCIMESQFSSRCMHFCEERLSIICTHTTSDVIYMFRQVGVKRFDAQILHQCGVSFLGAKPAIKKQKEIQVLECSSMTCKHK
jgi:hypothetical protein